MSALKSLKGRDYSVVSFEAHKDQSYVYISGSNSNPDQIAIDLAIQPTANFLLEMATGSDVPGFINDSGRYAYGVFATTRHYFYEPSESVTQRTQFYPSSSCYVISIGSNAYGEKIELGSFSLVMDGSGSITDGSDGKLYYSGTQIGNIFYESGIAVIQRDELATTTSLSANGLEIVGGGSVTISFSSTITIYEHTAICRIEPNEFNWTWNPSLLSGSDASGVRVYDEFISGSLNPYLTTIGLYNDYGELMAIAKLSQAIPRVFGSQQTIIVQFDT